MSSQLTGRVAEEIRAELGRKRMTQTALADLIGQSPMYVSRRLFDGTALTAGDVVAIARVLGVDVRQLLGGIDPLELLAELAPGAVEFAVAVGIDLAGQVS